MPYKTATDFKLHSVDHGEKLFGGDKKSVRHLLGESDELITPEKLKLSFSLDGAKFSADLSRENGAIAENAEVILLKEDGVEEKITAPKTFAYYNQDRSVVLTFQEHNRFEGLIVDTEQGQVHHFVGKDGELEVNAESNDFLKGDLKLKPRRNLGESKAIDYWSGCYPGQSGLSQIDVGGAIGFNMYDNYGQTTAINYFNSYFTLSNSIYEPQMDVSLNVATMVVATSTGTAGWANSGCSQAIDTQLTQMVSWSKPSTQDIWHLLDDCFGSSGSTLGIAYVGVLCHSYNSGVSYMSEGKISTTDYPTWTTVAHEVGHNFNAQHSFEQGQGNTGGIMDYGPINDRLLDGDVQFNTQYRRSEVCQELTTAANNGCLALGAGGPTPPTSEPAPTPNPTPAPTSCPWFFGCRTAGEDNRVERELNCVKHRNVKITAGENLSEVMSGMTLSQCRSACASHESCVSFSFNERYGYCAIDSGSISTTHAAEYDTYTCGGEDISESVDDILESSNVEELMDKCCSISAGGILGMNNRAAVAGDSKEMCQAACVMDSTCAGVMFDGNVNECLFFSDTSSGMFDQEGITSMLCNRECISEEVGVAVPGVTVTTSTVPVVAAGVAATALVGVVAALLVVRRRRASN